jgi:hypothetical protein
VLQDPGHAGEGQHVVHHGGLAEQALEGGQGRLCPNHSALAFEAVQQRGLLSADISPCPKAGLKVEGTARAHDGRTEIACPCGRLDGRIHGAKGVRVLGTDIDEALGGADGKARDDHALDQGEGIALHEHPVSEGAAVALIRVADDVLLRGLGMKDGVPLDAGGKAGAAAPAQAGQLNLVDDLLS